MKNKRPSKEKCAHASSRFVSLTLSLSFIFVLLLILTESMRALKSFIQQQHFSHELLVDRFLKHWFIVSSLIGFEITHDS
jgi:hypothetical protein